MIRPETYCIIVIILAPNSNDIFSRNYCISNNNDGGDGISRLIHGFGDKESRGWSRGFRIGVGMIMIVAGITGRSVGIRL